MLLASQLQQFILSLGNEPLQSMERKHTQPKVAWRFLLPIASLLEGVANARRKARGGSVVLPLN